MWTQKIVWWSLLALALITGRLSAQDRIEPLRLLGVYDAVTGDWITRATIRDTLGVETQTTRTGVATLNVLTPIAGFYLLEIRKEGYQPRRIRLLADSVTELMIPLSPNPLGNTTQLPAMVVTERQRLMDDPGLREGFFNRCQSKGVNCLGRSALDRRPTGYLATALGQVDGIHRDCMQSTHGAVFNPAPRATSDIGPLEGCLLQMRPVTGVGYCTPMFIVDGFEWRPIGGSVQSQIDRFLPLSRIEGIEVYPANGPHPQKFDSGPFTGCGTIVIWTR